jgi:predicted peptidase
MDAIARPPILLTMPTIKLIACLSLLLTLSACQTMKPAAAAKFAPTQSAEHFVVERRQVLAADYLLFLPEGYDATANKRWPLIFFLHGAGERGTNLALVAKHGPPKIDTTQTNFPFIVVSPQCPEGKIWSNDLLLALLDEVEKKYAVDTHRVYLTGLSMGGYGAWSLGLSHPERFAALAPLCGGGDFITPYMAATDKKAALLTLPIWAFHGGKDPVVPVEESRRMVSLMEKLGNKEVKLTIYPEAGHDCWTETYSNPELFKWFLQHSR